MVPGRVRAVDAFSSLFVHDLTSQIAASSADYFTQHGSECEVGERCQLTREQETRIATLDSDRSVSDLLPDQIASAW